MTISMLRFVTLGAFLTALIGLLSTTPAFAGVGGGVPAGMLRLDPPEQPSSQPGPAHIKSHHKIRKIARHTGIRRRGT